MTAALLGSAWYRAGRAQASVDMATNGAAAGATWTGDELTLEVDDSYLALPSAEASLNAALAAWRDAVPELPIVRVVTSQLDAVGYHAGAANHNTLRFAPEGEPRAKGALAITMVSAETDAAHLVDADIVINGLHRFGNSGELKGIRGAKSSAGYYDLQNVLTHELGHWFGLDEDYDDASATMYAYVDPGETTKRDLAPRDIQRTNELYSQREPATQPALTCSMSPAVAPLGQAQTIVSVTAALALFVIAGVVRRRAQVPIAVVSCPRYYGRRFRK